MFLYDTTFKLGGVFVSVLILRFEEFISSPVVPLMIMLYERKMKEIHETFFLKLVQYFPKIADETNIYFVMDEEMAIVLAIQKFHPKTNLYLCWIHLF